MKRTKFPYSKGAVVQFIETIVLRERKKATLKCLCASNLSSFTDLLNLSKCRECLVADLKKSIFF